MAAKGLSFKLLAPKDIAVVLNMVGVHPAVTPEVVDHPSNEIAQSFFQALGEFAFDVDAQQIKAQMPGLVQRWGHQHVEIYDEAMDVLSVFKLARQLALINLLEDFTMKDMWEPTPKRFRILLSAMINFCRYKEGQIVVITGMKEDLQALDVERIELIDKSNQLERTLNVSQDQHARELHEIRAAEMEVQRVQSEVDKLMRQKQSADRVVEEAEATLNMARDKLRQKEEHKQRLAEQAASLQGQIAESAEGIEQEIGELQAAVREQRRRLEETTNEKRSRMQRDQVLTRLSESLEVVREELSRLAQASDAATVARDRNTAARDGLSCLQQSVEARRAEEAELEQRIRQISLEHERSKQTHEDRVLELEARRQQALMQHHQLQAKRTEEQRLQHSLQTQRSELEAEVAGARRAHEAEMAELRERHVAIQHRAESYLRSLDALLAQCGGDVGALAPIVPPRPAPASFVGLLAPSVARKDMAASPEAMRLRQRIACTPSPARVTANPLGFLSPSAPY